MLSLATRLVWEIRTDLWGDTGQYKRLPVKWESRHEQRACPSSDNSRARGARGVKKLPCFVPRAHLDICSRIGSLHSNRALWRAVGSLRAEPDGHIRSLHLVESTDWILTPGDMFDCWVSTKGNHVPDTGRTFYFAEEDGRLRAVWHASAL